MSGRKNGVIITGATKASYTSPPTTAADNGAFFAVAISNLAGSVTSNNAILTVQVTLQSYLTQFAAHECKARIMRERK